MLLAIALLYMNIDFYKAAKNKRTSRLDSYIEACCIWMLFLFVITELLSEYHLMRFKVLFPAWAGLDAILLVLLTVQLRNSCFQRKRLSVKHMDAGAILRLLYYGVTGMIGAAALLLALGTAPYNWDSMTYHLPRITYWVQNRSVEHYATNNIRQIASPVLGEFVNLHVCILSRGSDALFNMLQLLSYVTNGVMTARIARKLGCSSIFCQLSALLYMAMPIAFAEALTTQVDNFATVWLLFYLYLLLDLAGQSERLRCEESTVRKVCMMGSCVAWGYLAKPSVCVAMLIFAVWLLLRCLARRDRMRELSRLTLCALPCVVIPIFPELLRNLKTFQAYASKSTGARQLVATLQPSYLLINFLKNFSFNMPVSLIRNSEVIFAEWVRKAAEALHVELNAVSIAEDGMVFRLHEPNNYGCDTAVNPIIMWLFIFCVVWSLCMIGNKRWRGIRAEFFWTGTISFAIFCVILRWELFVCRYMVSYLAIMCPMIASCIQTGTERKYGKPIRYIIVGAITACCIVEAVNMTAFHYEICMDQGTENRPYGYFAARKNEGIYYAKITDEIKGRNYDSVGLYLLKADDYEYPIWMMLGNQRIEHINVRNESKIYADKDFVPDCIIWFGALPKKPMTVNGMSYTMVEDFGEAHYLFEKAGCLAE